MPLGPSLSIMENIYSKVTIIHSQIQIQIQIHIKGDDRPFHVFFNVEQLALHMLQSAGTDLQLKMMHQKNKSYMQTDIQRLFHESIATGYLQLKLT